jgi:hypothetical protein
MAAYLEAGNKHKNAANTKNKQYKRHHTDI